MCSVKELKKTFKEFVHTVEHVSKEHLSQVLKEKTAEAKPPTLKLAEKTK